jgi:hypothetical protein
MSRSARGPGKAGASSTLRAIQRLQDATACLSLLSGCVRSSPLTPTPSTSHSGTQPSNPRPSHLLDYPAVGGARDVHMMSL